MMRALDSAGYAFELSLFRGQHSLFYSLNTEYLQRVDTIKREMFSQKSVRRFVGDSSAFVMGAMFLASALYRGIHSPEILKNVK